MTFPDSVCPLCGAKMCIVGAYWRMRRLGWHMNRFGECGSWADDPHIRWHNQSDECRSRSAMAGVTGTCSPWPGKAKTGTET